MERTKKGCGGGKKREKLSGQETDQQKQNENKRNIWVTGENKKKGGCEGEEKQEKKRDRNLPFVGQRGRRKAEGRLTGGTRAWGGKKKATTKGRTEK